MPRLVQISSKCVSRADVSFSAEGQVSGPRTNVIQQRHFPFDEC